VGAGPGDPGLITVKGMEALRRADVVLYDNLAPHELLEEAPAGALRIYVGKKKGDHVATQEEINALLLEHARAGRCVVRLKGGDPFLFGRGGEEAELLAREGLCFEVVPGVTAAFGISAYTGVPLTHREHTSAVTFVTGHHPELIDWAKTGQAETLLLYMAITHAGEIARRLMAAGRAGSTPAVIARWATRPDQQVWETTLAGLEQLIAAEQIKPPATIVVGEVAWLRPALNWFERLPLFGKTIVVTRAGGQGREMAARLRALGAHAVAAPAIAIAPPADAQPLAEAVAHLERYDWLLFTSVNGVEGFVKALDASARDWRGLRAKICAIGPATAAAVADLHLRVDIVPSEYVAESLVEAFAGEPMHGARVLLPRAAVARDVVPDALRERGAVVDVVEAYRTVAPEETAAVIAELERADWVTFTSSSTVKNFLAMGGRRLLDGGATIASIGPVTSATCRAHGLEVSREARPHTVEALIAALME
jgi:uroporphyrinogen III methyltransferase / synthase